MEITGYDLLVAFFLLLKVSFLERSQGCKLFLMVGTGDFLCLECHIRWVRAEESATGLNFSEAEFVHLLWNCSASVWQWDWVSMLVDWADWLVNLNECTVWHLLDDTGLDAVFQNLTVGTLQAEHIRR